MFKDYVLKGGLVNGERQVLILEAQDKGEKK
jgi:hypothetical protein